LLGGKAQKLTTGTFCLVCLIMQGIICYLLKGTDYKLSDAKDLDKKSIYNFYVGVALMMFVGFGYLMTFLKSYGLGAVGFTALITCLGVEWALCIEQLMAVGTISVDLYAILNGNFAVAAVLISFGALIGKISPTQVVVLTVIELVCYCANKVYFLTNTLAIADCGGTVIIHLFGCYFGLACSTYLGVSKDSDLNGSIYTSDLFSLIGTVFLWLFWPSFVAGALPAGDGQDMALINTVMALLASTVITFILTPVFSEGRLATVPIQNATLAGGVSIGATANLPLGPFGATLIGLIAGAISTYGFCKQDDIIPGKVDTCGINNLHGMPSIFGGIASAIVPMFIKGTGVVMMNQLIGVVGTFIVSIVTGAITGVILKTIGSPPDLYTDETFWECADDIKTE
jgi:ammonium transporter Rh